MPQGDRTFGEAGEAVRDVPYYGLMEAEVGGVPMVISQTGFTGEKGYEVYVRDASVHAETVWNRILELGERQWAEMLNSD